MLTFEQKLAVFESFPELERRNVSLGRVNFHYENSLYDKKTVAYHLHPNGNGFVYAGLMDEYKTDAKGLVNIRDFSEDELRKLVEASIRSLSQRAPEEAAAPKKRKPAKEQRWHNNDGQTLLLKYEDELWYIYIGLNLEAAFETFEEAEEYLREEGFTPTA
ncbi:hypothetical protein [Paenibacillus beijingensis]|uniref:Uncharacterized protein n=1 Tax=Paenibacillus beijingensis TaxID=1126833 RepID=A0A0D5NGT9_9BACL|nr:hypothetical protein [Paenibacillus beijingensis]AJY74118.1 hypothetical protein VN24_05295 [Paenibacillus beijingensis]